MIRVKSNRIMSILILLVGLLMFSSTALAIPTLQLDILGGYYDKSSETIMSPGDSFTLYALLNPNRSNTISDTYYISAALTPKSGGDLGSFTFNGAPINVTSDMYYGTPPVENLLSKLQPRDSGDLQKHGIFPTYFREFEFTFKYAPTAALYNTQYQTGKGPTGTGGMYWMAFNVDTSLLNSGYAIHFDLYNTKAKCGDEDITQFAPFSHDAESSRKVPESSTMVLLGFGLMGVSLFGRKKN